MTDRFPQNNTDVFSSSTTLPINHVLILLLLVAFDVLWFTTSNELLTLQALLGLPVVLYFPGYVLVDVLFPRRRTAVENSQSETADRLSFTSRGRNVRIYPVTWKERVALSFGMSLALLPLLGLLVAPIVGSFAPEPLILALNTFIVLGLITGFVRHNRLPKDEQFRISYRHWASLLKRELFSGDSQFDHLISIVLVLSVLAAVSTMGFALVAPQDGEAYTSATLLTRTSDGDLVAAGYPTELRQGEEEQMTLKIENKEHEDTSYTVVGELQRVNASNESVTVESEKLLFQKRKTVTAGESWLVPHSVIPTREGEQYRLAYYIYRGEPPQNPNESNAYRNLFLWFNSSDRR